MYTLSLFDLMFAFIPAGIVIVVMARLSLAYKTPLYGMGRMVLQLLIIGYFLIYIFEAKTSWVILVVLGVMLLAAGWIAMRTVPHLRKTLFPIAFISIALGGGFTLILITQVVIGLAPWYQPSYMIPLAGMIFANAMNAISIASERAHTELQTNPSFDQAHAKAFNAAMIPVINMLFAVGLVSLPGMMTGQILSGVSPLIAARYQIMVMAMMFGGSGLSVLLYLRLARATLLSTPRHPDV